MMASTEQWMPGGVVGLDLCSPPANVDRYAKKPLPPLPPHDRSRASSFRSEVSQAFRAPKIANQDGPPFMFDWEVESAGRSVRLHQSLGPDDMIPLRLRARKHSLSAVGSDPSLAILSKPGGHRAGQSSAGLERRIARATAGPDPRPPLAHRHTLPAVHLNPIIPTVPPDEILSPQPRSSVQKILKLTGNMSPTTSLSTDTPSLHNSTQKIRQLTGLDFGPGRGNESQLQTLQEDVSLASSELSFSLYSHDIQEDISCEPAESVYSQSCVESVNELITPLAAAPRYIAPVSPPPGRYDPPLDNESAQIIVKEALQLSGFAAADIGVMTPEENTPITGRRDSWYADHSGEESHSSSSSEISESEFEMEPTAAELYHDSAVAIAKSSPFLAYGGGGDVQEGLSSRPRDVGWDSKHQTGDTVPLPRSRGSTQGSMSSPMDSALFRSPSAARSFAFNRFRKKDNLSERRGRRPSPLETATPQSSWGKQLHRIPYPPVSSTIRATFEEAEDGQARLSLLARIFTNGSGSSVSMGKRDSTASGGSGGAASVTSAKAADKTTPTSTWSPDTPSPGTITFGDMSRNSAGLLARTMANARQAGRRKTKVDKAEEKKVSVRGKIRVLRGDDDESTAALDKLPSPGP